MNLALALQSRIMVMAFADFLKREFSLENLLCYFDCQDYERRLTLFVDPLSSSYQQSANTVISTSSVKLYKKAQQIYETYLKADAPLEISISAERKETAAKCLESKRQTSLSVMSALCITVEENNFERLGQKNITHLLMQVCGLMGTILKDTLDLLEKDAYRRFVETQNYRKAAAGFDANCLALKSPGLLPEPVITKAEIMQWKGITQSHLPWLNQETTIYGWI